MNTSDPRSTAEHLATVIPLIRPRGGRADGAAADRVVSGRQRAIALLDRRCGPRWAELPDALGRTAARASVLVTTGPTAIDPASAPADLARSVWPIVNSATSLADLVPEEADVLGEALGCDLTDLRLDQLDELATAIRDLELATSAEPIWASPAAAATAEVYLSAVQVELRATATLHDELYRDFTERVLEVSDAALRASDRPWRLLGRARLRRQLARASRTGRVPGSLKASANKVRALHEARLALADLTPVLSAHLVPRGWQPLGDIDALASSLKAVRRYQSAMGDRLVDARLADLLSAGAFQSPELVGPATNLSSTLTRWRLLVERSGGDLWAMSAPELALWAASVRDAMPAFLEGLTAVQAIDAPVITVGDLVDDLLLREHVADLESHLDTDVRPTSSIAAASAS